jgi:hypothetical protein
MPGGKIKTPAEDWSDTLPQPPKKPWTTMRKRVVKKILASLGSLPEVSIPELVFK